MTAEVHSTMNRNDGEKKNEPESRKEIGKKVYMWENGVKK